MIKGDVTETIPAYVEKHPGLLISLLYCDLDLYEPTKVALELLWPHIAKGGIVVFDEAIMEMWSGEMVALKETLGLEDHLLHRIPNLKQFYLVK